jgi:hypothetical protein
MTTRSHRFRRLASASLLAAAVGTAACFTPATGQGSTWAVTQATWGTTSSVGSFAWAIDQANNSATNDVISVGSNLQISVDGATGYTSIFNLATITRSVTILIDVFGDPRTTGGLRDVGAVELRTVPEPTTITLAAAATLIGLQLRRRRGGEAK